MKKLSAWRLALVFPGLFFGAGFVSGQELWQFFGVYGYYGVLSLILSIMVFVIFTAMVISLVHKTGIQEFSKITIQRNIPWLRRFLSISAVVFLFICIVVMIAGCGAMLKQLIEIPSFLTGALFCLLLSLIAATGRKGVVNVLNAVTPLMAVVCVVICVCVFYQLESTPVQSAIFYGGSPLTGSLPLSTLSYISYNMLPSISVIIALADSIQSGRDLRRGLIFGGVILLGISMCILFPMITRVPLMEGQDLPMLSLAAAIHPALGAGYTVILFGGMLSAATACLFAFLSHIGDIGPLKGNRRLPSIMLAALMCSLMGFKRLISVMYPLFGYIGIVALTGIARHYIEVVRGNKPPDTSFSESAQGDFPLENPSHEK